MYRTLFVLLIIALPVAADDKDKGKSKPLPESPYAKAKVGDWVSTKMSMTGQANAMTSKTTVVAKTDDVVTLKVETVFGDIESPPQEVKIKLKEKIDPLDPPAVNGVKPVVKKLGEGKEKITVGGKSYDCDWIHMEVIVDVNGMKIKSVSKTWTCKDVPCGGLVKTESDVDGRKSTIELTGHGNKK